jgi:hypothetical protein
VEIDPVNPSTLTATIPENPSTSPITFKVERVSPRISQARRPVRIG